MPCNTPEVENDEVLLVRTFLRLSITCKTRRSLFVRWASPILVLHLKAATTGLPGQHQKLLKWLFWRSVGITAASFAGDTGNNGRGPHSLAGFAGRYLTRWVRYLMPQQHSVVLCVVDRPTSSTE